MRLPSIRTKSPSTRNSVVCGIAVVLLSAVFFMGILPAEVEAYDAGLPLGVPIVEDEDAIALLGLSLGGYDVAAAAWSNMNPSEKQTLRDQAGRIARMAQGAELDGLASSSDVARTLRWGISSFLADAWEKKIASETDLSENAARSFYETNRSWYMGSGAVRYRKAVYSHSRRDAAMRAKEELQKAPLSRLKNSETVDWTEYESIAEPLSGALRGAFTGVVMGPIETGEGYVLYEVLERREDALLSFEECQDRVKEDMVRMAVIERLEELTSE